MISENTSNSLASKSDNFFSKLRKINPKILIGSLAIVGFAVVGGIVAMQSSGTFLSESRDDRSKASGISCGAGECNDGYQYGQDCSAPQVSCVQRNNDACANHRGHKSGGGPINCGTASSGGNSRTTNTCSTASQSASACRGKSVGFVSSPGYVCRPSGQGKDSGNNPWCGNYYTGTDCIANGQRRTSYPNSSQLRPCCSGQKHTRDGVEYCGPATGVTAAPLPSTGQCSNGYVYCNGSCAAGKGCFPATKTCNQWIAEKCLKCGQGSSQGCGTSSYLNGACSFNGVSGTCQASGTGTNPACICKTTLAMNGQNCSNNTQCYSGYCSNNRCAIRPTPTPSSPTPSYTAQRCSATNSTNGCTSANYENSACSRNGAPGVCVSVGGGSDGAFCDCRVSETVGNTPICIRNSNHRGNDIAGVANARQCTAGSQNTWECLSGYSKSGNSCLLQVESNTCAVNSEAILCQDGGVPGQSECVLNRFGLKGVCAFENSSTRNCICRAASAHPACVNASGTFSSAYSNNFNNTVTCSMNGLTYTECAAGYRRVVQDNMNKCVVGTQSTPSCGAVGTATACSGMPVDNLCQGFTKDFYCKQSGVVNGLSVCACVNTTTGVGGPISSITPTPTTTIGAEVGGSLVVTTTPAMCTGVHVWILNRTVNRWEKIDPQDYQTRITSGANIRISASGTGRAFQQARFRIKRNDRQYGKWVATRSKMSGEFYIIYRVPANGLFEIQAQLL